MPRAARAAPLMRFRRRAFAFAFAIYAPMLLSFQLRPASRYEIRQALPLIIDATLRQARLHFAISPPACRCAMAFMIRRRHECCRQPPVFIHRHY